MSESNTPQEKQVPLNLNNFVPALVADGNLVAVNNDNGAVTLSFFQLLPTPADAPTMSGNVVASIRMNIDQARQLSEQLLGGVANYKPTKKDD